MNTRDSGCSWYRGIALVIGMLTQASCGAPGASAVSPNAAATQPRAHASAPLPVRGETLRAAAPVKTDEGVLQASESWTHEFRVPGAAPRLVAQLASDSYKSATFSHDGRLLATV